MHPLLSHQRQVHLDFHTSPYIPDVSSEFDAAAFAKTFKDAHVNSVTIFAKCHHGMSYYPTKTGTQHPALKGFDLLGAQIEALHCEGIRAPIYTTVAWEEDVADKHPEWRQLREDGTFARVTNADPTKPPHPGGWKFNNFLHPDYQDYIEAHVRELLANYDVDGLFFDILFMDPRACWSDASVKFREKHNLLGHDPATQTRFETAAQVAFSKRFTSLIRGIKKDATIFYNSPNPICADSRYGVRTRHDLQSHWELESLPSGFWGYHHFPRLARAFGTWGKPWLGMTGRFQRMWGDFGGLKPQPALEYECFRSQALGGANSIGDQLPPRGQPDAGAYDLIGAVFAQCAAAEPFYKNSTALPQVGIIAPGDPSIDAAKADQSLEGAVQMCEENHYDSIVLDDKSDLDGLDLVILPDSVVVTPPLQKRLAAFHKRGGKLIASHRSGFIANSAAPADPADTASLIPGLDLKLTGDVQKFPTYWRARSAFSPELSRSDRVVYEPGVNVTAGRGITTLVERVLPYFRRTDLTFSSHFQTPPQATADRHAAVLAGKNFVYFADPIFREYRHSGNIAVRDGWRLAMHRLIGPASYGDGLPTTILSVPRRRGSDLLLTLLHYIPTRKALSIDMIEERSSFAGEELRLPAAAKRIVDFDTNSELPRTPEGTFILPIKKGRLLLRVPGFF
ncbi:alpha-amylase family protein [Geminisphaera colitermitum]|uniref:alpha-amylase family protein n=1 Tax=Geminisphaera colitermitum TaxID=1148786 RepID=UPI0001964E1F|nr:alpha-amylase family protein [Geminisphaera colitermitum]